MPIPVLKRLTDAAEEPLSLTEVKTYLRIEGEYEDELLTSMIKAATNSAENYMSNSILNKKYQAVYDNYVAEENLLPKQPVTSITEVRKIASDDSVSVIPSNQYFLSSGNEKIIFIHCPSGKRIEIDFFAGLASSASGLPHTIKQALLCHIANMYERKVASSNVPELSKQIYNSYKKVRL